MASEIEICNLALSELGQGPILNLLDPQNRPEQLCALHYPIVRDAVLAEAPWAFATQRFELDAVLPGPAWGSENRFIIPAGVLHVWRVYKDAALFRPFQAEDWVREGNAILCPRFDKIYIKAIMRITDTTTFNVLFTEAVYTRLAANMCIAITESTKLQGALWALYGEKIDLAKATETSQGRRERVEARRLTSIRRL